MQRNRCSSDTSTRSAVLFGSGGSGHGRHWFLMMLPWIELFLPMFGWQDRKHHVTFLNARLGLRNQSVSCRLIPIIFSALPKKYKMNPTLLLVNGAEWWQLLVCKWYSLWIGNTRQSKAGKLHNIWLLLDMIGIVDCCQPIDTANDHWKNPLRAETVGK